MNICSYKKQAQFTHPADSGSSVADSERTRAPGMTPEERREMIISATIPFFLEHGPSFTSKKLSEHLDLAEGTIFRAFGDKESLVQAVVKEFFERGPRELSEGIVDPALPLEEKVAKLVTGAQERVRDVFKMFSFLSPEEAAKYRKRPKGEQFRKAVVEAFKNNEDELTIPLDHLASLLQIAAIAGHASHFDANATISHDELVNFILYGIAGHPAERNNLAR
ncbi:MAG: TetR/AcrR family transcriptional regulator [Microbacteriaceae bacterium]|nr:TetR/AcrR family transcriptional regulator [Microbacteriaceae bacterium]